MALKEILNKKSSRKAGKKGREEARLILQKQDAENYAVILQEEMNYRLFLSSNYGEPLLWVEKISITDFSQVSTDMQEEPENRLRRFIHRMIKKLTVWPFGFAV